MVTEEIRAIFSDHADEIACSLLGKPSIRSGHNIRFGRKDGLSVSISGTSAGLWNDFSEGTGGDIIALVQHVMACSFSEAVAYCAGVSGVYMQGDTPKIDAAAYSERLKEREAKRNRQDTEALDKLQTQLERAAKFWNLCGPLKNSAGEAYLRSRLSGEAIPDGVFESDNVRWVDGNKAYIANLLGCEYVRIPEGTSGAIVSKMTDPLEGHGTGLHLTFLDSHDKKIGRSYYGKKGILKLFDPEKYGETITGLGIGEGIESALSASIRYSFAPMWAMLDAGAMKAFPVLPYIDSLTIFADNDPIKAINSPAGAGQAAAIECGQRWTDAGREAVMFQPKDIGEDFNDVQERGAA